MNQNHAAVIKQQANCWIGWIEEVPRVNCQEETRRNCWALCVRRWQRQLSSIAPKHFTLRAKAMES